jgi:hypothetical protein
MLMQRLFNVSLITLGLCSGVMVAWAWVVGCAWLDSLDGTTPFHPGLFWPVTKVLGCAILVTGLVALLTRPRN